VRQQDLFFPSNSSSGALVMATKTAKPSTKGEILNALAEKAELKRKQVSDLMDQLAQLISKHLKSGSGVFTLPGLVKFRVVNKPATPERQGINPFTKQPTIIKAKPARRVVKAGALKALKDMVK
jgi:nucleoid DNA-binding protein